MGLKEKQALANVDFGWSEKRILEHVGQSLKIEVQADTVMNDLDAIYMLDNQGAVYLANAIAKVCHNQIGKDAFNDKKVKKILLINYMEAAKKKVAFNGETLELHGAWGTANDYLREAEIQSAIEDQL